MITYLEFKNIFFLLSQILFGSFDNFAGRNPILFDLKFKSSNLGAIFLHSWMIGDAILSFFPWIFYFRSNSQLSSYVKMVFCYQNYSDLLWEKIALVIEKNFWNSRLKGKNLQVFWDHMNNLFKQWKVRTISGDRILF